MSCWWNTSILEDAGSDVICGVQRTVCSQRHCNNLGFHSCALCRRSRPPLSRLHLHTLVLAFSLVCALSVLHLSSSAAAFDFPDMDQPGVENGSDGTLPDDAHTRHMLALRLAREAGDIIFSLRFGGLGRGGGAQASVSLFTKSGESDLVTTADHASQEHIFSGLNNAYPSHRLIGEETKESHAPLDEKPTWIVDAIDGTTNFVHGVPHFAVCIAHARDKTVELGVVYNPYSREMFHGVRGKGSYMNGRKLNCSKTTELKDALILSEWGYVRDEGAKSMLAPNERLLVAGVRGVRQLGSGALDICYVAMGMADGVYCGVEDQKRDRWHIWDYAAASVIAKEAGATMSTVEGDEFNVEGDSMVCTTPGIMDALLEVLHIDKM